MKLIKIVLLNIYFLKLYSNFALFVLTVQITLGLKKQFIQRVKTSQEWVVNRITSQVDGTYPARPQNIMQADPLNVMLRSGFLSSLCS